ncbi:MAG: hypothetical protein V1662_05165, partial [Candidatus Omnitrophota bacterium]
PGMRSKAEYTPVILENKKEPAQTSLTKEKIVQEVLAITQSNIITNLAPTPGREGLVDVTLQGTHAFLFEIGKEGISFTHTMGMQGNESFIMDAKVRDQFTTYNLNGLIKEYGQDSFFQVFKPEYDKNGQIQQYYQMMPAERPDAIISAQEAQGLKKGNKQVISELGFVHAQDFQGKSGKDAKWLFAFDARGRQTFVLDVDIRGKDYEPGLVGRIWDKLSGNKTQALIWEDGGFARRTVRPSALSSPLWQDWQDVTTQQVFIPADGAYGVDNQRAHLTESTRNAGGEFALARQEVWLDKNGDGKKERYYALEIEDGRLSDKPTKSNNVEVLLPDGKGGFVSRFVRGGLYNDEHLGKNARGAARSDVAGALEQMYKDYTGSNSNMGGWVPLASLDAMQGEWTPKDKNTYQALAAAPRKEITDPKTKEKETYVYIQAPLDLLTNQPSSSETARGKDGVSRKVRFIADNGKTYGIDFGGKNKDSAFENVLESIQPNKADVFVLEFKADAVAKMPGRFSGAKDNLKPYAGKNQDGEDVYYLVVDSARVESTGGLLNRWLDDPQNNVIGKDAQGKEYVLKKAAAGTGNGSWEDTLQDNANNPQREGWTGYAAARDNFAGENVEAGDTKMDFPLPSNEARQPFVEKYIPLETALKAVKELKNGYTDNGRIKQVDTQALESYLKDERNIKYVHGQPKVRFLVDADSLLAERGGKWYDLNLGYNDVEALELNADGEIVIGSFMDHQQMVDAMGNMAQKIRPLAFLGSPDSGINRNNWTVCVNGKVYYIDGSSLEGHLMNLWRSQPEDLAVNRLASEVLYNNNSADRLFRDAAELAIVGTFSVVTNLCGVGLAIPDEDWPANYCTV